MTPEKDTELGCIGHVRMDFGHGGKEFWHTWWPRGDETLNSPEFKAELNVVDEFRKTVLKDLPSMSNYCYGKLSKDFGQYGYLAETDNYRYCLRCNPKPGDYQAYLTCFDKRRQEPPVIGVNSIYSEIPETVPPDKRLRAMLFYLAYHRLEMDTADLDTKEPLI